MVHSLSTKTHIVELKLGNLSRAVFRHQMPPKKKSEFLEHKRSVASNFRF
jgi:hypothetical protein